MKYYFFGQLQIKMSKNLFVVREGEISLKYLPTSQTVRHTLKEETFTRWKNREIFWIYFREWTIWLYFARINFRE